MEHIWELVAREWRLRLFTKHFGAPIAFSLP